MHSSSRFLAEITAWLAARLDIPEADLAPLMEVPPSDEMGDHAFPCFTLAKRLRKAPNVIAQGLAAEFQPTALIERARSDGPYVNFFVNRQALARDLLGRILAEGEAYGNSDEGAGRTVVIDYSSPNIAKHLGVHHIRSVAIGKAIYNIYTALGYRCHGINFLGDWGTNFGQLIVAIERWGQGRSVDTMTVDDLMALYVRFHAEAERQPELLDEGRRAFQRIEAGDPAARAAWQRIREISLREFDRMYAILGARFDEISGESLFVDGAQAVLQTLIDKGIARESEGALVADLEPWGLHTCLLRKKDGSTVYVLRDLAAALHHHERFEFHLKLYVVGGEQRLHFQQVFKLLELMGTDIGARCVHVDFGLIKFVEEETGKATRGSTRKGRILLLQDVIDEAVERARQKIEENRGKFPELTDVDLLARQVGIGAAVFSDLGVRRSKDVVFDWDRILDFEGDTGPYVQYAHARLCSILRKAEEEPRADADFTLLTLPEEWRLLRHLDAFPAAIAQAARQFEPCVLANYLLTLCAEFSRYYSAGMRDASLRVLAPDPAVRAARLALVRAALSVIRKGLGLLGIEAPERM